MKQTTDIGLYQFEDAFRTCGRIKQFSYEGLKALFEYLEEYEEGTGEEIELDVIGLCCDYCEYDSLDDFHNEYDAEDYPDVEKLQDFTTVIPVTGGGFIIGAF